MRTHKFRGLIGLSIIMVVILLEWFVWSQLLSAQDNSHKLRIFIGASSNNFPPVNVLDKDGNLTGFGRDLSDAVIKAIGGKITHIHSARWDEVLEWLDTGKADFIHDTGYTKDRDEFLDFSDPILEMPEVIFVRPDQYDITSVDSLKGKTVACVKNHITHLYLQTFPEINCYVVNTPVEGLYELVTGKVDAFVYPKQIILYLAQSLRLRDKIKITGSPMRTLTWSMVVKEGNKNLLQLLNEGIAKVRQTGEYERIYDKWWGRKLLAGYSKRELQIFTTVTTGISIVIVSSITLFFFNRRLRRDKKVLETEIKVRHQTEKMLRESEERIRSVLETSPVGISIYDETGQCFVANDSLAEMIGATKEQVLQQNYNEIESWKISGTLDKAKSAMKENKSKRHELIGESTFGQTVRLDCYLAPLSSGHLLFMAHDISKRIQAEEKLARHLESLEELVEERTDELTKANQQLNQQIEERKKAGDELKKRTDELKAMVNAMAGREIRMVELKKLIKKLRVQIESAGLMPVADDPLKEAGKDYT